MTQNGEGKSVVMPIPRPIAINLDVATGADGTRYVALNVHTEIGWQVYFLQVEPALQLAKAIRSAAYEAQRLVIPEAGLHLPGDD